MAFSHEMEQMTKALESDDGMTYDDLADIMSEFGVFGSTNCTVLERAKANPEVFRLENGRIHLRTGWETALEKIRREHLLEIRKPLPPEDQPF